MNALWSGLFVLVLTGAASLTAWALTERSAMTRTTGHALADYMTEDQWKARVIDTAKAYGWRVAHQRPARTAQGWRTAIEGDAGLPDLVLARNGVVLLVELKTVRGRPTAEQAKWLAAAGPAGRLWRPTDWLEVQEILRPHREEI